MAQPGQEPEEAQEGLPEVRSEGRGLMKDDFAKRLPAERIRRTRPAANCDTYAANFDEAVRVLLDQAASFFDVDKSDLLFDIQSFKASPQHTDYGGTVRLWNVSADIYLTGDTSE